VDIVDIVVVSTILGVTAIIVALVWRAVREFKKGAERD